MLDEYWNVSPTSEEVLVPGEAMLMIPLFPSQAMQIARVSMGARVSSGTGRLEMGLYRVSSKSFNRDFTDTERSTGNMSTEVVDYELVKKSAAQSLGTSFSQCNIVFEPNIWLLEHVHYAVGVAADVAWRGQGGCALSSLCSVFRRATQFPLPAQIDFRQQTNRNTTGTPAVCARTIRACRRVAG